MTNEEAIREIESYMPKDEPMNARDREAFFMAIAALKAEPCDTLKLDGMLEDAYEQGYQQARYDYEVQPCEDAVKREAVLNTLDTMDKALDEDRTVEAYKELLKECYKALPSVILKPRLCKDCKWWKDGDGVYRRGIGAESQCPINRKEVYEGNGYCYLYEPRESAGKDI